MSLPVVNNPFDNRGIPRRFPWEIKPGLQNVATIISDNLDGIADSGVDIGTGVAFVSNTIDFTRLNTTINGVELIRAEIRAEPGMPMIPAAQGVLVNGVTITRGSAPFPPEFDNGRIIVPIPPLDYEEMELAYNHRVPVLDGGRDLGIPIPGTYRVDYHTLLSQVLFDEQAPTAERTLSLLIRLIRAGQPTRVIARETLTDSQYYEARNDVSFDLLRGDRLSFDYGLGAGIISARIEGYVEGLPTTMVTISLTSATVLENGEVDEL